MILCIAPVGASVTDIHMLPGSHHSQLAAVQQPQPAGMHQLHPSGVHQPQPAGVHQPQPAGMHIPQPLGVHQPQPAAVHQSMLKDNRNRLVVTDDGMLISLLYKILPVASYLSNTINNDIHNIS